MNIFRNKKNGLKKATFAGGCFWCMEKPYDQIEGIVKVVSGYTGGYKEDPTYEEVCTGATGHLEAVEITYDPSKISYGHLLDIFWRQIDPTDPGGQFNDRGTQYKTAILYHDEEQKRLAQGSKQKLSASGRYKKPVVTRIIPAPKFYEAESYHQGYYKKNPEQYNTYHFLSGRGPYLKSLWKEPL